MTIAQYENTFSKKRKPIFSLLGSRFQQRWIFESQSSGLWHRTVILQDNIVREGRAPSRHRTDPEERDLSLLYSVALLSSSHIP